MATSASRRDHDDSDDEFESADEGEPTSPVIIKPPNPPTPAPAPTPPPAPPPLPPSDPIVPIVVETPVQPISPPAAVNDGWGDWNIDDDQITEVAIKTPHSPPPDSISSRSSTPSKTSGSLSHVGSDEDDPQDPSNQQYSQRKKYRKKPIETSLDKNDNENSPRVSRPTERHSEEKLSTVAAAETATKHDAKDAHHVLDRLAAQSPTRTVS